MRSAQKTSVLCALPVFSQFWLDVHFREVGPGPDSHRVRTQELSGSRTSFVDDVERCFGSAPETREAGGGDHFTNALFARLRA